MLVVAMATTVGAQTPVPGAITIVHGVRGLVADVYLDGTLILETFQPERTTAPVPIAPGSHVVEVRVSGAPAGSPPALTWPVEVAPDDRISAVVHLDAAGAPTVTRYDDDLSQIPAGQSRVAVRHAAAAGPIDVRLGDQVLATNLANAQRDREQRAAGGGSARRHGDRDDHAARPFPGRHGRGGLRDVPLPRGLPGRGDPGLGRAARRRAPVGARQGPDRRQRARRARGRLADRQHLGRGRPPCS